MNIRPLVTLFTIALGASALACGPANPPAAGPSSSANLSGSNLGHGDSVVLSDELKAKCAIPSVAEAPKFAFDSAALAPDGLGELQALARCVTDGALRGHHLQLVGRADARGPRDYNMALGQYRADAVALYLESLGVPPAALGVTSRGELDARGTDERSWALDRRVDVALGPQS